MLYDILYPWQKQIVDKFEDRTRFGLFLDMGLGKTPVSLAFAERHRCTKVIIVSIDKKAREDANVPGSFANWAGKMEKQYNIYTKKHSFRATGPKKWQATLSDRTVDMLVINYESLYSRGLTESATGKLSRKIELKECLADFIESCEDQNVCVILDESHKVKELDTLQTRAVQKMLKLLQIQTPNLWLYLLTGTPFTQGFIDLYAQLKLLGWEGTKTLFTDAFCIRGDIPGLMGWQQPIVAYKNVDKLYGLVHNFALTIKSGDVIKLPEQVFVEHELPQTKEMVLYTAERLKREFIEKELAARGAQAELEDTPRGGKVNNPFYRNIAFPDLDWLAETVGAFWLRARQLSIGFQGNAEVARWFSKSRLDALETLLSDNPDNYVLFYNFTPELLEIYDICEKLGYNIDVYCGEMKSERFYQKYQSQEPGERLVNKKNIIIANYASGSTGANWQLYNKCILFSIPLYKDYEQSIKRVHRIGQTETVVYHMFYSSNWLDRGMLDSLRESREYDKNLFEADLKRVQALLEEGCI